MPAIPIRHHEYRTRSRGQTRYLVSSAHNDVLRLSGRALEILSVVSGSFLTSVQRRALLPALEELLGDSTPAPIGAGPLSQADVLGASLGLAAFCTIFAPSRWTFVHIPSTQTKSPDIYALSDSGRAWFLELKAVAPLDSDVQSGGTLDTCMRISAQRSKALLQLDNAHTPIRTWPAIRAAIQGSVAQAISTDARAFTIVVLPRAGLAARPDILGPGKPGCPPQRNVRGGVPCARDCLSGRYFNTVTAPVALFGKDEVPVGSSVAPNAILGSLRVVNGALWAGATVAANDALLQFAFRAGQLALDERRALAPVAFRYLQASRMVASIETRQRLGEIAALGLVIEPRNEDSDSQVAAQSNPLEREILRSLTTEVREPLLLNPPELLQSAEGLMQQIETSVDGVRLVGTRSRWGVRALIPDDDGLDKKTQIVQAFLSSSANDFRVQPIKLALEQRLHEKPRARRIVDSPYTLGVALDSSGWSGWMTADGLLELHRRLPDDWGESDSDDFEA